MAHLFISGPCFIEIIYIRSKLFVPIFLESVSAVIIIAKYYILCNAICYEFILVKVSYCLGLLYTI